MQVRRATPGDAPALLHIWLDASRVGHSFLGEETLQEQLPKLRDVYIPHADNWVAASGDAILGFIGLVDNHVRGLFVAPAAHRRGVGRLLLDHASGRLGELTVEVYEQNRSACSFYRSCGFDLIGRKELDDEGRPLPLLRMKRASEAHKRSPSRA
jgi:putative acetyltransferase